MNVHPNPFLNTVTNSNFLAGFGAGAVVTLLVMNPAVQRLVFRTVAKATALVSSGIAETKERFHDAQAEIQHESTPAQVSEAS